MSILFTADLHLTDRPSDEYRWGLFAWLAEMISEHRVKQVILGGDITDAKDKHSAVLTNRLATELLALSRQVQVIWIRGNHDYIDENQPFFGFLGRTGADITFVTEPMPLPLGNKKTALLLPNTRNYKEAWAKWLDGSWNFDLIFCHQTFDGCKSETGYTMEGIPPSVFEDFKGRVYSGDIHKPQKVGKKIEYVGAPYRIRFGDEFEPRVLLIKDDLSTEDLFYPCLFKATIDIQFSDLKGKSIGEYLEWYIGHHKFQRGDQIKIRTHLPRLAYAEWPEMKRQIIDVSQRSGILLTGPELISTPENMPSKRAKNASRAGAGPEAALDAYAEGKGLDGVLLEAGRGYLKSALND